MADEEEEKKPIGLIEANITLIAPIDPADIVRALNGNDESVLQFICQVLALSESSELRERLTERLSTWADEDYL